MPSHRLHAHRWAGRRLHGRRQVARTASRLRHSARRQRLRLECHSAASCGSRRHGEHPAQGQSQVEKLLLAVPLPQSKRHRANVLPPQGFSPHRDPIRSKCRQLPRRSLHRGHYQLLVMSPDPKEATLLPHILGAIVGAAEPDGRGYDVNRVAFRDVFGTWIAEYVPLSGALQNIWRDDSLTKGARSAALILHILQTGACTGDHIRLLIDLYEDVEARWL